MAVELHIPAPSPKQAQFFRSTAKYVCFGGARGGGKSWAVRVLAVMYALKYPKYKVIIIRKTYPELLHNHIRPLQELLPPSIAKYNASEKTFTFGNGSTIVFMFCQREEDLQHQQGLEAELICLDEATQHPLGVFKKLTACLRSTKKDYPLRMMLTCNPGGIGHEWVRTRWIDRKFSDGENPDDFEFIQSLVTDNLALMRNDSGYIRQLEALDPKLRKAWLEGSWDIFDGIYFETFRDNPNPQRKDTHVIEAFDPPKSWKRYRSYDFGYSRPFSCGWWCVDHEGRMYRILELYGCTDTPNEGVKWTADEQFAKIAQIEREHPWLAGHHIEGVADPAIFAADGGVSIADTAAKHGVFFSPGDNKRIPGWMQCRYRLHMDANGVPMMYVFDNCKAFRRTIPLLVYDDHMPEDLDSDGEDHPCGRRVAVYVHAQSHCPAGCGGEETHPLRPAGYRLGRNEAQYQWHHDCVRRTKYV